MLDETFYLDGADAKIYGLNLQKPVEFSAPIPIVEKEHIEGRNGDIIYDTGAYENRTASAVCYALARNVKSSLRAINHYLFGNRGYRRFETSDDAEHFWLARVSNGARIEQRLRTLAPFEIEFDCKPQAFLKVGEIPIYISGATSVFNKYGYDALPIIKVYGTGAGSLSVGDFRVDFTEIDDMTILDCDLQNAYNGNGNRNMYIDAPEFPVLKNGENKISFSGGITKIQIIPRWWEL
jgi:phage-related protein